MARILRWALLVVVAAVFAGGCNQGKDVIVTNIEGAKPADSPKLPGSDKPGKGGEKPGKGEGSQSQ
jgi:hypothetical protein